MPPASNGGSPAITRSPAVISPQDSQHKRVLSASPPTSRRVTREECEQRAARWRRRAWPGPGVFAAEARKRRLNQRRPPELLASAGNESGSDEIGEPPTVVRSKRRAKGTPRPGCLPEKRLASEIQLAARKATARQSAAAFTAVALTAVAFIAAAFIAVAFIAAAFTDAACLSPLPPALCPLPSTLPTPRRNLRNHQLFYAGQGGRSGGAIFLWRFPFFCAAEKPEKWGELCKNSSAGADWTLG
jgi:hypothetical protein